MESREGNVKPDWIWLMGKIHASHVPRVGLMPLRARLGLSGLTFFHAYDYFALGARKGME